MRRAATARHRKLGTGDRGPGTGNWEPVWQGDSEGEAEIVAGRLRAAGIRAHTQGARATPGGYPHAFLRDTWAVTTPASEAARARRQLRSHGHDPGIVEGGDGVGLDSGQRATLRLALWAGTGIAVLAAFVTLYEWAT